MKVWLMSMALIALALSAPASAALGENVGSVQTDQVQMKATLRVGSSGKYTVHELQTPAGTLIREYASPSGTVFGVAWEGPSLPDLRQILGTYFNAYTEAPKTKRTGRRSLAVEQAGLVVHSRGHVRAFFGQAYIPQMLPPDVSADEIQ
jgi:hypothetical protein